MDQGDESRRIGLQRAKTSTLWQRLKIGVIAAFLGFAVGTAVLTIVESSGGVADEAETIVATFLGLMVAWAFDIIGSHLVRIWAMLSDQSMLSEDVRRADA